MIGLTTVLGFDARMQFLHEDDLRGVLQHAVAHDVPGTFNVAGDGILMLSQAIRRLQRPSLPMPGFAVGSLGNVLRSARLAEFSPEQTAFLTFGRGVDTTQMRDALGFEPQYSTAEAFADFAADLTPTGGRAERALAGLAERLPSTPAVTADRPIDLRPALSVAPEPAAGGDRGGARG